MSNGTAVYIKRLEGWRGDARLYKIKPGNSFVVVSAAIVPFTGPETYIFESDSEGIVADFSEQDGSFRGALDHEQALRGAGYEVAP